MMRSFWMAICMSVLSFCAVASQASAAQAGSVEVDGRKGQGVVFTASGRCLGLTAGHVVGDASAGTIYLQNAPNQPLRFSILDVKQDVALVQVDIGELGRLCRDGFFPSQPLQRLLDSDTRAQIKVLDGDQIGTIGGTVTGYDPNLTSLQLQPFDRADARMERGISGSVMLLQGAPIAIVTDVRGIGFDPEAIGVPIEEIRRLFPTFLPQPRSARVYGRYDVSWLPREFRQEMEQAQSDFQAAKDEEERARAEVVNATAIAGSAIAVPNSFSSLDRNQVYFYTSGNGQSDNRGQIRATLDEGGGTFSYNLHGLAINRVIAGPRSGRVLRGRFIDGTLRSGEILFNVTPSRPEGTSRRVGSFEADGSFRFLASYLSDQGTYYGRHINGEGFRGRYVYANGSALDGFWPAEGGGATGYCIYWRSDGSFERGGTCENSRIVKDPLRQP